MDFFVLENNQFTGPLAFGEMVEPVNIGEGGPRCPVCGDFVTERPWEPPYRVRFLAGTESRDPGDLVFGDYADFIASENFRAAWQRADLDGIDGWDAVNVARAACVFFKPRFQVPTVRAHLEAMQIDWKRLPECEFCGSGVINALRRLCIMEETWAGQALFRLLNLPGLLVASSRFVDMVVSSGITNANFIPAGAYEESFLG